MCVPAGSTAATQKTIQSNAECPVAHRLLDDPGAVNSATCCTRAEGRTVVASLHGCGTNGTPLSGDVSDCMLTHSGEVSAGVCMPPCRARSCALPGLSHSPPSRRAPYGRMAARQDAVQALHGDFSDVTLSVESDIVSTRLGSSVWMGRHSITGDVPGSACSRPFSGCL